MKQQDENTYMKVVPITDSIEHITFFWWAGGDRKQESGSAPAGTAHQLTKQNNWILI